jgi:Ca2+-binding EF-hand superfamily protein
MRGLPLLPLLLLLCPLAQARQYPDTAAGYLALFDRDGDGRISASEYVAYLSAGFHSMDTNGDAVLDAHELPPGPRRTPRTLAAFQDDVRAEFHRLDNNRDGYLDARELAQPPR